MVTVAVVTVCWSYEEYPEFVRAPWRSIRPRASSQATHAADDPMGKVKKLIKDLQALALPRRIRAKGPIQVREDESTENVHIISYRSPLGG